MFQTTELGRMRLPISKPDRLTGSIADVLVVVYRIVRSEGLVTDGVALKSC
jgi:hypothetical protein